MADASKNAYGGTVYIRIKTNKGVTTKIVTSKTRIGPLKGETIPRLELLAALTLANLIVSVQNALKDCCKIESIFCWSDSLVALWWIHNDNKKQKQFVENRVSEIRDLVSKDGLCCSKRRTHKLEALASGIFGAIII